MSESGLLTRLERVERVNRRLKWTVAVFLSAAMVLCIVSATGRTAVSMPIPRPDPPQIGPFEELQLRPPQQQLFVRFRVFKTGNMWNQLLLDTADGMVWQVSYTIDTKGVRALIPINATPLATGKDALIGRFTLYPTDNIWTFLLVDQFTGSVWQCQFSTHKGDRMLIPINPVFPSAP